MKYFGFILLLGAASALSLPGPDSPLDQVPVPVPVYGVVDNLVLDQLKSFRDLYKSELVKQLQIAPEVADNFIKSIGYDNYRDHLNQINVDDLLFNPVVVLLRDNAKDQNLLSVYFVIEGISSLSSDSLTKTIHDSLRSGDNVPIVFYPSLLPSDSLLKDLQVDRYVSSVKLDVDNFARISMRLSEMPWVLVQPKAVVNSIGKDLLKQIGSIEVLEGCIKVVQNLVPVPMLPELRTSIPIKMPMPMMSSDLGTFRADEQFFNWSALKLPALQEIPGIIVNFPVKVFQDIVEYFRPSKTTTTAPTTTTAAPAAAPARAVPLGVGDEVRAVPVKQAEGDKITGNTVSGTEKVPAAVPKVQ